MSSLFSVYFCSFLEKLRSVGLIFFSINVDCKTFNCVSTSCPQGVFSLKTSHFEPRYVLLIPTRTEDYISHMKARGFYTEGQIEKAVSRIDFYAKINRERPGFFDSVILCGGDRYCLKFDLILHLLGMGIRIIKCVQPFCESVVLLISLSH